MEKSVFLYIGYYGSFDSLRSLKMTVMYTLLAMTQKFGGIPIAITL